MNYLTLHPLLLFVVSFIVLWLCGWFGAFALKRHWQLDEDLSKDFDVVLTATLTLLGLIIGFSFAMAISRYDQRKAYEEEEANAIGTEYLRAELLPAADAAAVRRLLRNYLDQRVRFYTISDVQQLPENYARTAQLQSDLWSAVKGPAVAQPTPIAALVVAGMNDVLNTQGYTQAAWWNRIPLAAWGLMFAIAICCNVLVGFGSRSTKAGAKLLPVLPLVLSIAFMLIADIDSPRNGIIRVSPLNLHSLVESMRPR